MSEAISRVAMWLAALQAGDWPTLLSLHDPQSLVIAGPQVLPAERVDAGAYAMVQSTVAGSQSLPAWNLQGASEHTLPGGTVVLATLGDRHGAAPLTAGFHLGDGFGITGMVAEPGAPATVSAEAAADLTQLPPPGRWADTYLTALHHSLARRRTGVPGEIRALPEARFTCQGRGDCCNVEKWKILVNDNQWQAAQVLTAAAPVPFALIGEPPGIRMGDPLCTDARHRLGARDDGRCHQLTADGGCRIHAAVGWQPVAPCQLYPYRSIRTPDGFDLTALFSCLTVCYNQGLPMAAQEPDLRSRLWPYQHRLDRIGDTVPLTRDGDGHLAWSEYKGLEASLLDGLAGLPDTGGLAAGSQTLAGLLGPHAADGTMTLAALLEPVLHDPKAATRQPPWLGGGGERAWQDGTWRSVTFQADDDLLARYLRTVLFRKTGLAEIGVAFPWFLTLVAYHLVAADARYRAARAGRDRTSGDDLVGAVQAVEVILAHTAYPVWLAQLPQIPFESPRTWTALLRL